MPPSTREPALRVGDEVSVAVRHFGQEYARGQWRASNNVRDTGVVVERNGLYLVDFRDGEDGRWWQRKLFMFVSRSEQAPTAVVHQASSSEGEHNPDEEVSSSSSESSSSEDGVSSAAEGEGEEGKSAGNVDGWERNDEQFMDERQKHGFQSKSDTIWNSCPTSCRDAKDEDDPKTYFIEICVSWFNETSFQEMAAEEQEKCSA